MTLIRDEAPTPMILGIDSSLSMLSVALVADSGPVASVAVRGEGSRNEKLLPAIDWLLTQSGLDRSAIATIVVTRGPGSFTGVRIGLATAQGLAFSLGARLFALSTHEAALPEGVETALVHGDAGRGEYYVSGFRSGCEVLPPTLATPDDYDRLRKGYPLDIDVARESSIRSIALAAALKVRALGTSVEITRYTDPTPLYVRPSEAEVRLERRLEREQD